MEGHDAVATIQNSYQIRFDIENQDKEARLLQIEYRLPKDEVGAILDVDPFDPTSEQRVPESTTRSLDPAPTRTDGRLITYEIAVLPLSTKNLTIQVRWKEQASTHIRAASSETIRRWLRGDASMSDLLRAKLRSMLDLTDQISQHTRRIQQLLAQKNASVAEQTRVRENLQVLGSGTTAAEPFLERLNEMEAAIRRVDADLKAVQDKANAARRRRDELIGSSVALDS